MCRLKLRNPLMIKVDHAHHCREGLLTFIAGLIKNTCHPTDLVNRDFGTLSDLSECQLSVVCRTSESHLEGERDILNHLLFLFLNLQSDSHVPLIPSVKQLEVSDTF